MNSEIENLNCEEFKEILEDEGYYIYYTCELRDIINEIKTFIIFPPYEKNYINKLKENFIKLKKTFKETRYILYLMECNYINEIQYPLNIMDEIELNIINKLLSDSLKYDGLLMEIIPLIKKLVYFLKNFYNLEGRYYLNTRGIFNISQYKEYFNINIVDKEIFDILPL